MTALAFPAIRGALSTLSETYVSSDQILKPSANMGIALLMPSMVCEVRMKASIQYDSKAALRQSGDAAYSLILKDGNAAIASLEAVELLLVSSLLVLGLSVPR